jgi:hypothetical protein
MQYDWVWIVCYNTYIVTCEADFQTAFTKWLKNRWNKTGAFELKFTKSSCLPFSAVKDHQLLALQHANRSSLVYKISDGTLGQKPFDCFCLSAVPAYIVVRFEKPRCKKFYMITVGNWLHHIETSQRRSLTEKMAGEIGETCYLG